LQHIFAKKKIKFIIHKNRIHSFYSLVVLGVISTTTPELKSQDVCIRKGCNNAAVQHPEWDNEYCSVSCTYKHCKYVFIIL